MATTIPGEEFRFDLPYYTNKIGELSVLLEQAERKRMILFGSYMELKNKYEPEVKTPPVVLDMNDSKPVDIEAVHYGTEPPQELPSPGAQVGAKSLRKSSRRNK